MSKQAIRYFFVSFTLTLLFSGFLIAFTIVDLNSGSRAQNRPAAAFSSVPLDKLHYEVHFLGREQSVSLERLDRAEGVRQRYACLLTPRAVLTAQQLWDAGANAWDAFYPWYMEYLFEQEAAA